TCHAPPAGWSQVEAPAPAPPPARRPNVPGARATANAVAPPAAPAAKEVAATDRRYMQSISYQKHCASCHPMPSIGITIAHADMGVVRTQIATLPPVSASEMTNLENEVKKGLESQREG